jgi:hypothetical protein
MKRLFILMLLLSELCFAQQNAGIRVTGRVPDAADGGLYQMQVGAFRLIQNAANAYEKLRSASLNPSYEQHLDLIRVMIKGVSADEVPAYIEKIRKAGFSEVFIKIDPDGLLIDHPPAAPPLTAVVPAEDFYILPESGMSTLPKDSKTIESFNMNSVEYLTEPTFRLAYGFMNKGESRGASGENGGLDILGRGPDYEWLWTTYYQGGWFYDLNGFNREMIDGYQKDPLNGVELTIKPEFIYNEGVPYLQLRHIVSNPGNYPVRGQKFGASADIMINKNDDAPLLHKPYGAYMADSETNPALELIFVCESGDGIDPVDTLWLGRYGDGLHMGNIYSDSRSDVRDADSAICFSYQNIDLGPGEEKEFVVRFTLVRMED